MSKKISFSFSAVFILAALLVFNNETLRGFNRRALCIARGDGTDEDVEKMNPWICESHSIHSVVQKAKKVCKAWQIELAVYAFVALARCTLLKTLITLFGSVRTIMTSKCMNASVQKAFTLLQVSASGYTLTIVA